jgi:galactose-1-phosphate uridylyltransferase
MTTFAFPSGHNPQTGRQHDGMTLRDYFAAKAMTMIPYPSPLSQFNEEHFQDYLKEATKAAYQIADAMIKVRDEL